MRFVLQAALVALLIGVLVAIFSKRGGFMDA
jgi:hypothetical protein